MKERRDSAVKRDYKQGRKKHFQSKEARQRKSFTLHTLTKLHSRTVFSWKNTK